MTGDAFAGWQGIRLMVGDGSTGLRIVVAMYDPDGRPGAITDLVAGPGGIRQESLGARMETDGSMSGTHWLTEGDRLTPRPLTETELSGLRSLAQALWRRCKGDGAA